MIFQLQIPNLNIDWILKAIRGVGNISLDQMAIIMIIILGLLVYTAFKIMGAYFK